MATNYYYLICALPIAWFVLTRLVESRRMNAQLDKIPAIGPSGILTSYIGAIRYLRNARAVVQEGYEKARSKASRTTCADC